MRIEIFEEHPHDGGGGATHFPLGEAPGPDRYQITLAWLERDEEAIKKAQDRLANTNNFLARSLYRGIVAYRRRQLSTSEQEFELAEYEHFHTSV